jgi:hypothetical protein
MDSPSESTTLRLYPIVTHIAEKLHAYTMPRPRPNSRVKDLPDIALLATAQPLEARPLREALEQTFTFRTTHALPAKVPEPLAAWATPYAAMASDDELIWPALDWVVGCAFAARDPGECRGRTANERRRGLSQADALRSPLFAQFPVGPSGYLALRRVSVESFVNT